MHRQDKESSPQLYIPELCLTVEIGDTDDNKNRESSEFDQCTRRLRLPNASLPNHMVLELSYNNKHSKTSGKGCKKMPMQHHLESFQLETYHLKLPANRL